MGYIETVFGKPLVLDGNCLITIWDILKRIEKRVVLHYM